jgi:hypothetical protein
MRRLRRPEMGRSIEHRAAARAKIMTVFNRIAPLRCKNADSDLQVLIKTEIVTMRPGWLECISR